MTRRSLFASIAALFMPKRHVTFRGVIAPRHITICGELDHETARQLYLELARRAGKAAEALE